MNTYRSPSTESLYSPSHAFLLQLHRNADPAAGACSGRIEQITSGDALHFNSLEELLAFLNVKLSEFK